MAAKITLQRLERLQARAGAGSLALGPKNQCWNWPDGFPIPRRLRAPHLLLAGYLEYRYAVLQGGELVRWYDAQPHSEVPELAETLPHHLHEPLDIKHNRKPAPGVTFRSPNFHVLIADCIALGERLPHRREDD